tara:strand:- start:1290 stop:1529 length:240 start_codon:yes stop_codon:yes gene_type:complete
MNTVKITLRKKFRSPKYKTAFGINTLKTGYRLDIPWHSIAFFGTKAGPKATIRSLKSGLNMIIENNRKGRVQVRHNVAS